MKVKSNLIATIDRDEHLGITTVGFNDGSVYSYLLPLEVHEDFVNAESIGRFFLQNVRGAFEGDKVRGSNAA